MLIPATGPVTEQLRLAEIDDDEGRAPGADRPLGQRAGGDVAAGADGAAVGPGHGRGRDREGRLHQPCPGARCDLEPVLSVCDRTYVLGGRVLVQGISAGLAADPAFTRVLTRPSVA